MKRTIHTLAAAVMAGAIAISATPAADAQTEIDNAAAYKQLTAVLAEEMPKVFTDGNGNYYQLVNGEVVQTELPAGSDNVPVVGVTEKGELKISYPDGSKKDVVVSLVGGVDGTTGDTVDVAVPEQPQGTGITLTADAPNPEVEVRVEGEAGTGANANADTQADAQADANTDADADAQAGAGSSNDAAGEVNAELSPGAIAAIAVAAVGVPIVIAGVTYFLNQDGVTLVGSSDRVNKQPTPEEKAKSDQLRAEHADEIAAQQVAAAADRGVGAETGSNTIARTLFALVIASVLGAAAFVAGRRFLV
ncbi:hypothetical protein MHJ86_04555 [Corynebacterium afermentans]|nr:hypothetical protein [Corynebacterium afermentans]